MANIRENWDLTPEMKQQQGSLFVTGHSLGAALATLATARLVKNGHAVEACYVFGSPRVGNKKFTKILSGASVYRIENGSDIVTSIPLDVPGIRYATAGECHYLDHEGRLHHKATQKQITTDRVKHGWTLPNLRTHSEWVQRFKSIPEQLPPMLADHAPVNYVVRLEKCL